MKEIKKKIILGIECTAHTLGAAIINDSYNILSNENISMKSEDSGLIPVEIMEHHAKNAKIIIEQSLKESNKKIEDVTHIAVSNAPGMGHALRVGNIITKTISNANRIPIIPVNHSLAHLTTGIMDFKKEQKITLLYIAGANTQIWNLDKERLMLVGETLDMGIGHMLDICAREIGYGFPGGPKIEKLALEYNEEELIELPYSIKGMDVSFGGTATSFKNKAKIIIEEYENKKITKQEYEKRIKSLCFSLQEHSFASLIEASERAIALQNSEGLSIIGGVALNNRFSQMASLMCKERHVILKIPERKLLADNAGMIAIEGLRALNSGYQVEFFEKNKKLRIDPYERLSRIISYKRKK